MVMSARRNTAIIRKIFKLWSILAYLKMTSTPTKTPKYITAALIGLGTEPSTAVVPMSCLTILRSCSIA